MLVEPSDVLPNFYLAWRISHLFSLHNKRVTQIFGWYLETVVENALSRIHMWINWKEDEPITTRYLTARYHSKHHISKLRLVCWQRLTISCFGNPQKAPQNPCIYEHNLPKLDSSGTTHLISHGNMSMTSQYRLLVDISQRVLSVRLGMYLRTYSLIYNSAALC